MHSICAWSMSSPGLIVNMIRVYMGWDEFFRMAYPNRRARPCFLRFGEHFYCLHYKIASYAMLFPFYLLYKYIMEQGGKRGAR